MDVFVDGSCSKVVLKGKSAAEVGSKRKTHEIDKKKVQQEQPKKGENNCKKMTNQQNQKKKKRLRADIPQTYID